MGGLAKLCYNQGAHCCVPVTLDSNLIDVVGEGGDAEQANRSNQGDYTPSAPMPNRVVSGPTGSTHTVIKREALLAMLAKCCANVIITRVGSFVLPCIRLKVLRHKAGCVWMQVGYRECIMSVKVSEGSSSQG